MLEIATLATDSAGGFCMLLVRLVWYGSAVISTVASQRGVCMGSLWAPQLPPTVQRQAC